MEKEFWLRFTASTSDSGAEYRAPKLAPQLAAASYGLLNALSGARFDGALLWLRRWEIWSEQIDNVGVHLLELIMKSGTSAGRLPETPAILFDESEFDAAYSIASLPLFLQWDAYVIPAHARHLLYIRHHESWVVLARDAQAWNSDRKAFDHWDRVGDAAGYLSSVSQL